MFIFHYTPLALKQKLNNCEAFQEAKLKLTLDLHIKHIFN